MANTPSTSTFVYDQGAIEAYIQNYIAPTLTIPGYEIYFFSRFNENAQVTEPGSSVKPKIQGFSDIVGFANCVLKSDVSTGAVNLVQSIEVVNTVTDEGSSAKLRIIEPDYANSNLAYLKTTMGDSTLVTPPDYDYSPSNAGTKNAGKASRIGTMDTILIKLKNQVSSTVSINNADQYHETVFRGVISDITRTKSVNGSFIDIQCFGFEEFLRRAMAIQNGIFSTIALAITGRGVVFDALNYSNNLFNGNKQVFTATLTPAVLAAAQAKVQQIVGANTIQALDAQLSIDNGPASFQNHAMRVPPFFYLEGSDVSQDAQSALGATNYSQLIQSALAVTNNAITTFSNAVTTGAGAPFPSTKEDAETISTYSIALASNGTAAQTKANSSSATNLINNLQQYAWVLSDLYLEKGLITFEHQYMWQLICQTAQRGFRECYIDFKPKLPKKVAPQAPYTTADVIECKADKTLDDIHPNIAIVKYRLSPCLLSYQDNNAQSEFWMYQFKDTDVLGYQATETERNVFTAILGYDFGFGNIAESNNLFALATSEHDNLALAQSIDTKIESRIGYRFMTNHDAKLTIPILRYFVSYVILEKTQLSMFSEQIAIPGRPDIVPGSIVRLFDKRADYYCDRVTHSWSIDSGYRTSLGLSYGHTQGVLPAALIDPSTDVTTQSLICSQKTSTLAPFLTGYPKTIGGVDTSCFIEALWLYMTNGAVATNQLQKFTKEAETSYLASPGSSTGVNTTDWITTNGTLPSTLDGAISDAITATGIGKYNVTLNTIKNMVQQESSFVQSAHHVDTDSNGVHISDGWGYFQLTFPVSSSNQFQFGSVSISQADAVGNVNLAAQAACSLLLDKFQNIQPNCSGDQFLQGIANYNSAYNTPTGSYTTLVFGGSQVQAIHAGTQTPASAGFPVGNTTSWPYYVYGPLGIRVNQANSSVTTTNTNDATYKSVVSQLENFNTGMTMSIKYIISLLNQYQTASNTVMCSDPSGKIHDQFGTLINQGRIFDKTIAAWYSNLQYDPKFNGQQFTNALNQIVNQYNMCVQCDGSPSYSLTQGFNLSTSVQASIYKSAQNLAAIPLDTSIYPGNGCVYAVQKVLQGAGLQPIGTSGAQGFDVAVPQFIADLQSSGRGAPVSASSVVEGDIWVVNGPSDFHVGIVTGINPTIITSNHSSTNKYNWTASLTYYNSYFPKSPAQFYRLNS